MKDECHTGFTGTRLGMTADQSTTLFQIMQKLDGWWHHGDCLKADQQSHHLAEQCGLKVAVHPPRDERLRAFCVGSMIYPQEPYLDRNMTIVRLTSALIAAPQSFEEELRSGTWATIRFARKLGRPITIILPNGLPRLERAP